MKALVDTNIILDALMRSRPSSDGANGVLRLCSEKTIDGYIAANSMLDIFILLAERFLNGIEESFFVFPRSIKRS